MALGSQRSCSCIVGDSDTLEIWPPWPRWITGLPAELYSVLQLVFMSRFFIERPVLANVIAIITILLGAVCLYELPVAQYPQIVPPTIQVSATYAGASAETLATSVAIPIEQAVNGVEGSIYMQSTSGSDGSYTLTITFTIGTDLNTSLALVQNAVNSALPQLPQQVRAQGVNVKKASTIFF